PMNPAFDREVRTGANSERATPAASGRSTVCADPVSRIRSAGLPLMRTRTRSELRLLAYSNDILRLSPASVESGDWDRAATMNINRSASPDTSDFTVSSSSAVATHHGSCSSQTASCYALGRLTMDGG